MKNQLKQAVVFALLLFSPIFCFGQYVDLGILSSFEAYSGTGAVTNAGTFTGDVGTYTGALTGFVSPNFTGDIYNSDAVTTEARTDLLKIYIQLTNIFVSEPDTHAPAFGSGETITPGVYSVGGAGSVGGNLTLDGGGDTNAVFIMEFGGAFTVGGASVIILTNGTRACNVFWIAQGAISVAAGSTVKGTLFAFPGAVGLGTNCNLEGRMLTSTGAITVGSGSTVIAPAGPIAIPITCSSYCAPAPAVDVLGSVANFSFFTSSGAVSNTGTSGFIGTIGTNSGAVSGFTGSEHIGSVNTADAITAQAVLDLDNAYTQLMLLPNTVLSHAPAFGTGETLRAGVYFINGAGSLAGTITLDGQNNPNSIFIFKFAGAFAVAAQSKVIFVNGVRRCNVFWIGGAGVASGAVSIGASSHMKGILLSHGGACTSGAGSNVEGRMLSTAGAIGFSTGVVYNSPSCVSARRPLPVELTVFTATAEGPATVRLAWATASEMNSKSFEVERSTNGTSFTRLGTVTAGGSSSTVRRYSFVDATRPGPALCYYRLRLVDADGSFTYSPVRSVALSGKASAEGSLVLFPNPSHGAASLTGAVPGTVVTVFDALGRLVTSAPADATGMAALALPAGLPTGMYVVRAGGKALRLTVE